MTEPTSPLPESYFHEDSASVRFWVRGPGGQVVGASVRRDTLHHRFRAAIGSPADALDACRAHRSELDAAVLRRVAAGSIEPVMLREHDLGPAPRR